VSKTLRLMEGFDSNYRYILVAARRARQLQAGAKPLVDVNSRKPCRIAREEIAHGKVKWTLSDPKKPVEVVNEMLDRALGQP